MSSGLKVVRGLWSSPWLWGGLYIAAIPLFALAYRSAWADFYQATARRDAETVRLHFAVEQAMYGPIVSFVRSVAVNAEAHVALDGPLETDEGYLFDAYVGTAPCCGSLPDDRVRFAFRDVSLPMLSGALDARVVSVAVSFSSSELFRQYDEGLQEPPLRDLFAPSDELVPVPDTLYGVMKLDTAIIGLFRRYDQAMSGSPAPAGGLTRYLYFSAVTITTLGYGDIVPMTDRARLLVAFEAVLGIVVIGFFINAVALRGRRMAAPVAAEAESVDKERGG